MLVDQIGVVITARRKAQQISNYVGDAANRASLINAGVNDVGLAMFYKTLVVQGVYKVMS